MEGDLPLELNSLNEPQAEAVSIIDGPLLVLAGAGSGKTRVLTYRIANIIESKAAHFCCCFICKSDRKDFPRMRGF